MNKIISYSIILILFTICLVSYLNYSRTMDDFSDSDSLDQNEQISHSKNQLIRNVDVVNNYILSDKENNKYQAFKIIAYNGAEHYKLVYADLDESKKNEYFSLPKGSYPNNEIFKDTLDQVHIDEIRNQIYEADEVKNFTHKYFIDESDDLIISAIDDTFLIFFVIAFLIMIGLFVLEFFVFLGRRFLNRDIRFWVYLISLIGAIMFYQNMIAPGLWPKVQIEVFMRPVFLMIPSFIIYQWFVSKNPWNLDFLDTQLAKFLIIFIMGTIGFHLANTFSYYIMATEERGVLMSRVDMTLAFVYSFALGNLFFNIVRHGWSLRRANKNLAIAEKKVLSSESKLQSIQSSVNPHFLYNSLNSIAALSKVDPERTEKMTLALSEFYKYHTNREDNPLSTISEEVEMLRSYLEIEKIRFEDRLNYDFKIADQLGSEKIPHFLLQPLVENAIKYGYDKSSETISVKIKIDKIEENIVVKIYDQGEPFSESLQKGFGLKSVTQKLKLYYPDAHKIEYVNQPEKHVMISLKGNRV